MLAKFVAVVLLGLAVAAPEREKRQIIAVGTNNCANGFQLTSNPCQSGQGRVYYAVPGDATKFVQCDVLGRAYIVQCPAGLVYNQATTSCQAQQVIVTQAPAVTTPCTAQALQRGQVYFPFPGDNTRFYECTGINQVQVLQCPSGLKWDSSRVACVYVAGTTAVNPTVFPNAQQFKNPCTAPQISGNHYYFAHPDPNKFIQCDNAGQAFVVACPSGLVWNQYYEVCASAFVQIAQNVVG
ncbi:chondroitin proteoglycan-2-like [Littorina saxatilis]|uniref:Chitin-binding type-2 domain-containing protein n=1 Tax=Littorina saxatilis TaxID=31220 RepID=A0AAN9AVJ7_9CAEN